MSTRDDSDIAALNANWSPAAHRQEIARTIPARCYCDDCAACESGHPELCRCMNKECLG